MRRKVIRAPKTKGVGWDVFECDGSTDGGMQICRVDDPGLDMEQPDNVTVLPAFLGDHGAIRHVIKLAKRGDKEAITALWEALDEDGLLNRILWKMADPKIKSIDYPEGYFEKWKHVIEAPATLSEFAVAVNNLSRANVGRLNAEFRAGRALFGALHHNYPEAMLDYYFKKGVTPEQAFKDIQSDSGI